MEMGMDQAMPRSTMMEEISRTGSLSQELEDALARLTERLQPILGMETPEKTTGEMAHNKPKSQMAEMIASHNNSFENILARLNSVISRLDV